VIDAKAVAVVAIISVAADLLVIEVVVWGLLLVTLVKLDSIALSAVSSSSSDGIEKSNELQLL
jgi:hypothetical protein